MQAYYNLTDPGRRPISGPMLVLQGTEDGAVTANVTEETVNDTCGMYPQSDISFKLFEGATHVPTLNAAQQIWLQWIEYRSMGRKVNSGCTQTYHRPLRSVNSYQKDLGFYLEISLQDYTMA